MKSSSPESDFLRPAPAPEREGSDLGIADYKLIRRIGKGSYGQVWLARSATGAYRALKVVFRDAFDSERPYEREFTGIKEFEPISRTHPGQLDVLHVGRDDEEGFFYYVMELADDASVPSAEERAEQLAASIGAEKDDAPTTGTGSGTGLGRPVHPQRYRPDTLQTRVEESGRLGAIESLEMAIELASALGHLHANGLVHRDIKPSNIIFVRGLPKLADIGLVAHAEEKLSIVGTEGFIPPEGPGQPAADLFALGKVFYEMATGKDRRDFPALPDPFDDSREQLAFVEFNEVILRCCEERAEHRYACAADLLTDLRLIRQGRSVRRLRVLERRLANVKRIALFLAIALLVLSGFGWQARQAGRRERQLNLELTAQTAGLSELQAVVAMENDRPDEALLWSLETLRRSKGDAALEARQRYRIGALLQSLPRLEHVIAVPAGPAIVKVSPDGKFLAVTTWTDGVQLHDLTTGRLLHRFDHARGHEVVFSPDGRQCCVLGMMDHVAVWDLTVSPPQAKTFRQGRNSNQGGFTFDGKLLVTNGQGKPGGRRIVHVWDVEKGELRHTIETGSVQLQCHPTKPWFASYFGNIINFGEVRIWDAESGECLTETGIPHLREFGWPFFSRDGNYLLTAPVPMKELDPEGASMPLKHEVHVYRLGGDGTPELQHVLNTERRFGERPFYGACVDDGSRLFLDHARGFTVWDLPSGEKLADREHMPNLQGRIGVAATDGQVAGSVGDRMVEFWKVADGKRYAAPVPLSRGSAKYILGPERKAGGRSFVVIDRAANSVRVWDLRGAPYEIASVPHDHEVRSVRFSKDARRVLTATADATARLFNLESGTVEGDEFRYEMHDKTGGPTAPKQWSWRGWWVADVEAVFSPDERMVIMRGGDAQVGVWDFETREARFGGPLVSDCGTTRLSVRRDGRYLLAAGRKARDGESGPTVWDLRSGAPVARGAIFPDEQVLDGDLHPTEPHAVIVSSGKRAASIWNWETGREEARLDAQGVEFFTARFIGDGSRVLTLGYYGVQGFQLWDARTGEPLCEPFGGKGLRIRRLAVNEEGTLLVSAGGFLDPPAYYDHGEDTVIQIWDLEAQPRARTPIRIGERVSFALSPDATTLASVTRKHVQLWDTASSMALTPSLEVGSFAVEAAVASDNRTVAVGEGDGTTSVWRIEPTSLSLEQLEVMVAAYSGKKIGAEASVEFLSTEEVREIDRAYRALRE